VNTFTGLNVADLTGGVYSAETLFSGDNFACFSFQLLQQGIPDFASNALNLLSPVTKLVNQFVTPLLGDLSCPQLGKYDTVCDLKYIGIVATPLTFVTVLVQYFPRTLLQSHWPGYQLLNNIHELTRTESSLVETTKRGSTLSIVEGVQNDGGTWLTVYSFQKGNYACILLLVAVIHASIW
jgi:hypothetical protein